MSSLVRGWRVVREEVRRGAAVCILGSCGVSLGVKGSGLAVGASRGALWLMLLRERSLRWESMHESAMPYLTQRVHGRTSSHFLHARWQLTHAFLTCFRLDTWRVGADPRETGEDGGSGCGAWACECECGCGWRCMLGGY